MTSINKQKFLAELGKLLTFMYEEDRLRAIGMYSRMFEEARDEQALIQSLISPTRQAVVVARAYNSNLGRLSLTSESKAAPEDRDENGIPDYVHAIEGVREKAWAAQGFPEEALAEEKPAEPAAEKAEEPAAEAETSEPAEAGSESEPEADEPAEEAIGSGEPEPAAAPEEAPETSDGEAGEEPAGPDAEKVGEPVAEEAAGPAEAGSEAEPEQEKADEVPAPAEDNPEDAAEKKTHEGIEYFTLPEEGKETPESPTLLDENSFNVDSDALKKIRRKPRVFALIVYILFAIPLTICAIAVLLIPALLFLGLSIASIICGVVLVSTAFKGFAVFADIMVLLGVSLVLFAFGLLFLWTAIWFIGGAIVGVVHGVAVLCEKWCYKEVLEA
ncbi:MAG: hypothetical protein IJH48_09245 [Oscillospiraceae bacterium]|nr:hypothetical protein [Oscillospiraceae bacterium]